MIKAVVFDMDGLMFDTERLVRIAWDHAGRQMGYDIPSDLFSLTAGMDIPNTRRIFVQRLGGDFDFFACRKLRVDYMMQYILDHGLPVKRGLYELLDFLKGNGYDMAIASSTEADKVEFNLAKAGVSHYFSHLVCGGMVPRGKPAPDIYLKAVELLGLEPGECIALEDAPAGILSAYRAGLRPVMVPDLVEPDEATDRILYAKVSSLSDVVGLLIREGTAGFTLPVIS